MILKAQGFGPGSNPLACYYQCSRVLPERTVEDDREFYFLTLEGVFEGGSIRIEMNPGWRYWLLNDNGGNVDTIMLPPSAKPS